MNQEDIDFLERLGWDVVCQGPLEIEFRDDKTSNASGLAAQIVLQYLKDEEDDVIL